MAKIAILGYSSESFGYWDPFTVESGLPGSEEAVVYSSFELVNKGYKVHVYMNPHPSSIWKSAFSNPRWFSESYWYDSSNLESYDLVLMWRRYDVETGRKRGKVVFFWSHDSPSKSFNFPKFDGSCVLSNHHKEQLSKFHPMFDKVPYVISGNGILPNQFSNPMSFKNPYSIGYFSNYSRGLTTLINLWPEIKKEFPQATLSICYGRQTWNTMSKESLDLLVSKIKEYKELGVTEYGKVGHETLANIMQNTSIWAYPCNTEAETFCITAIKCQVAGCVPVVRRIGALFETVHPSAPSVNSMDIKEYKELLFNTLKKISYYDTKQRLIFRDFGLKFTWEDCVNKWLDLYKKVRKY